VSASNQRVRAKGAPSQPRDRGPGAEPNAALAPWAIVDASFVAAAKSIAELPPELGAELAFAGRSNVGKSSLMNLLLGRRRLVRTSTTPGCTRQLAFFRARSRDGSSFVLVDLPGYGYAKRSKHERSSWARLAEEYLSKRRTLSAVVVLLDARHGLTETDAQLLEFLEGRAQARPRVIVVATKVDKLQKSRQRAELAELARRARREIIAASAVTGQGVESLWLALREATAG
jgi:GTP-binding protein